MKFIHTALVSALLSGLWASTPVGAEVDGRADQPRPVISEFVQDVVRQHPALRRARAELAAATARARGQARPLYNPSFEVGYDNALDNGKDVGLSQTLDLSGKRLARTGVAGAEVAAATARLAITRKALLATLLIALSDYRTGQDARRIAETRVALDEDFLALAERRNRAGDLPQSELLTARLTLAEARAGASAATVAFFGAEEGLLAVVGGTLPPLPPLDGVPPGAVPSVDDVRIEGLAELRLAAAQTETARAFITVARKNRIPDPTLGLNIGRERSSGPPGGRESTTLFGLRLSVPLPVRNSFSAEVDAAGAELIAAEQSYGDLRRRIEARLTAGNRRYRTASAAWRDWAGQGAASLEEQRSLLQKLWKSGEINAIDYIIQLNQTFATESAGVAVRSRLWTTWFEWLDVSGAIGEWVEKAQ